MNKTVRRIVVVLSLFVELGIVTRLAAEEPSRVSMAKPAPRNDMQDQRALDLLGQLNLQPGQAKKLIPLIDQAAALRIQHYGEQARLMPEMLEAYGAFAKEDALNQGFSEKVDHQTAQVHRQEIVSGEETTSKLIELEKQAAKILKPDQVELLTLAHAKKDTRKINQQKNKGGIDEEKLNQIREAKEESERLHREIKPQVGPVGSVLFHPVTGSKICDLAKTPATDNIRQVASVMESGTEEYPLSQFQEQQDRVSQIRAEINNWNLINGLNLNAGQIRNILSLYDTVELANKEGMGKDPKNRDMIVGLERGIEKTMNCGQMEVLMTYKPCLIPPKNLKNPVRAGQASTNAVYEQWLEKARRVDAPSLEKMIDDTLERETKHLGSLDKKETADRRTLLRQTTQHASKMSEAEFEINKGDLADQIAAKDRVQDLKVEIAELSRDFGLPSVVAAHMIKPLFMEQLRQRGDQLAKGTEYQPTNAEKAP